MGHYHFIGNEDKLKPFFSEIIDEEEYIQTIKNSTYLLTASYQAACESLYAGNKPVLLKREDKNYENILGIPEISMDKSFDEIINEFNELIKHYPTNTIKTQNLELEDISEAIEKRLKLIKS